MSTGHRNGRQTGSDRSVPLLHLTGSGNVSLDTDSADGASKHASDRSIGQDDPGITSVDNRPMARTPQLDRWQAASAPPVVTAQPAAPPSWIPHQLDPASKGVFEEIARRHTSNGKLKFVVSKEMERSAQELADERNWLGEAASYDDFITDLLFADEAFLLGGRSVPFTHINFHVCEEWVPEPHRWGTHKALRPPAKGPMASGRAFLTNHRLILFSAEKQRATTLKASVETPQDGTKPAGYQLRSTNLDAVHFQSIPLTHFRNVEMYVAAGTSAVSNIAGQRPFCCLPFRCCRVCYEEDMCSKSWYVRDHMTIGSSERMLSMGAVLPPWGNRSLLEVHLRPDVPLSLIKGFVVQLQCHSPGLRSVAQKPPSSQD